MKLIYVQIFFSNVDTVQDEDTFRTVCPVDHVRVCSISPTDCVVPNGGIVLNKNKYFFTAAGITGQLKIKHSFGNLYSQLAY